MKTLMLLGLAALLSACGGGGDDSEPLPDTRQVTPHLDCSASAVCK